MKIELGMYVHDMVTGFRGVATGRVEYLTGTSQIEVQPSVQGTDPTKLPESRWIDESRVVPVYSDSSRERILRVDVPVTSDPHKL